MTCLGNTAVFSVPLCLVDVDPNATGISVVSGSKTIEEVDLESGGGDASSVSVNKACCVNFKSVAAFCVENEGKGSTLIVVKEEAASTSGEKAEILVPKTKSAVVLAGTVGCKTEVLDTSGCVTESVKCKYF